MVEVRRKFMVAQIKMRRKQHRERTTEVLETNVAQVSIYCVKIEHTKIDKYLSS